MDLLSLFILAFLIFGVAPSCIYIVRGKTAAVLETFGKPHSQAVMPGLRFKMPWPITNIVARVNLQLQQISSNVSVKTRDNAFMTVPVTVHYKAISDTPDGPVKAHYELEQPESQINSYILNNVRQTVSGMDMVDLYANRDSMEIQVKELLSEKFKHYGYTIENVLVDEPQPSQEVEDSFNRVIASERLKEAASNEAEATRIKLVGEAQAEAESKKLQGQGMAEMREAVANGLQESMTIMKQAGLTPDQAIAFLNETNRLDTITSASAHGNMIVMDAGQNKDFAQTLAAVDTQLNKN